MNKLNGVGIRRVLNATYCSFKGFKAAFLHESAFRQELLLSALLFPISFFVATTVEVWLLLTISMIFLLFAEIVNSALEALADRISTEHHELIGRAKDMGSSCVFLAILILTISWCYALYLLYNS
ncbi:diacylglycerol kinase [Brumicola blandensis]|uniref:Diacylglycerol kinase n=1 Tax=Brumicola blandensis TaxID=3075611 RepID=A0AAW8R017_9ALTE|nr:diacylglycerol kinase [Alteromonas sp. W409]MDT0582631.1 diacylglycerol kinase [Alteromonas sp. W409]